MAVTDTDLLQFLYQVPVAILELSESGEIRMMNPAAAQLLIPITAGGDLENLVVSLSPYVPELPKVFADESRIGTLMRGREVHISKPIPLVLDLNLTRLNRTTVMAVLEDRTDIVSLREAVEEERVHMAQERGRAQAAATVLHDIGNATTGITTTAALLHEDSQWEELRLLRRVSTLLEPQLEALDGLLGPGKGSALLRVLNQIEASLESRRSKLESTTAAILAGLRHVEEVLSQQRGWDTKEAVLEGERHGILELSTVMEECLLLRKASMDRKGITLDWQHPPTPVEVSGDATRLRQVINNILCNAEEALLGTEAGERRIFVELSLKESEAILRIADSGDGFDAEVAEKLFTRGMTTKESGSGIGLWNSRNVLQAHEGSLDLSSPGRGCGAEAQIRLPLSGKTNPL